MKKFFKFILFLLLLAGIGLGVLYYYINSIVMYAINEHAPEYLGTEVQVENIEVSPLAGLYTIKGLVVKNPQPADDPERYTTPSFIEIPQMTVRMKPQNAITGKLVFEEIIIYDPLITREKRKGKFNYEVLMDNLDQYYAAEEAEDNEDETSYHIKRFVVINPKVRLKRWYLPGKNGLTLGVPRIYRKDLRSDPGKKGVSGGLKEVVNVIQEESEVTDAMEEKLMGDEDEMTKKEIRQQRREERKKEKEEEESR